MPLTPAQFIQKGHGKTSPWMDLVNSEEWDTYGKRTDWLDDRSWLPFFLRQWRFTAPERASFPVAKFKALRLVLRKSCETLFAGRNILRAEIRALNDALSVTGTHRLSQSQNGLRVEFAPESGGWDWVLAQTALSFALLLSHAQADRVKVCQNPDCRWVFYDQTKGRTRIWCSDKVCGNRDRVRRARARTAR